MTNDILSGFENERYAKVGLGGRDWKVNGNIGK